MGFLSLRLSHHGVQKISVFEKFERNYSFTQLSKIVLRLANINPFGVYSAIKASFIVIL